MCNSPLEPSKRIYSGDKYQALTWSIQSCWPKRPTANRLLRISIDVFMRTSSCRHPSIDVFMRTSSCRHPSIDVFRRSHSNTPLYRCVTQNWWPSSISTYLWSKLAVPLSRHRSVNAGSTIPPVIDMKIGPVSGFIDVHRSNFISHTGCSRSTCYSIHLLHRVRYICVIPRIVGHIQYTKPA
jgi:hypothetical protein